MSTVLAYNNLIVDSPLATDIFVNASDGNGFARDEQLGWRSPQLSKPATLTVQSDFSGQVAFDWFVEFNASGPDNFPVFGAVGVESLMPASLGWVISSVEFTALHQGETLEGAPPTKVVAGQIVARGGVFPSGAWWLRGADLPGDIVQVRVRVLLSGGFSPEPVTLHVGGFFVGTTFEPPKGLVSGWSSSPSDSGVMGKSNGGQGYPGNRVVRRIITGQYAPVPISLAYGDPANPAAMDFQRIMATVSTTGFAAWFPVTELSGVQSDHLIHRLGAYGHFTEMGPIRKLAGNRYQPDQWTFEELL